MTERSGQASSIGSNKVDCHGHCSFCFEAAAHILRACRARVVPRRNRRAVDADGHLSRDQHPRRDHRLAIHRAEHAGDGTARHDLQPICTVFERERHQRYRGTDHQRHLGSEGLLSTRRESRSRDLPDRVGNQLHPPPDAAGHPSSGRGSVQRVERSGAADRAEFRHAQRAAALRLRHLPVAAAARAHPRHHDSDPGGRQVSPNHGRYRPAEAAGQGADPDRRRQRRQRPEPDAAVRHGEDRRHAVHRPHQRGSHHHRGSQQHSGEIRERRHRVREGRGAGARRQCRAAEHRAHRRPPLGPAQHHQERQRLDAGRRQRRQAGAGRCAGGGAVRHADQGAVRSIGIRQSLDTGTAARRRHRRRPDRADDRAFSRILALDAGGHDLDPAVHPLVRSWSSISWATLSTR